MKRKIRVPYEMIEGVQLPIIRIIIKEKISTLALVDSGASFSIFQGEIASEVGINLEKGKLVKVRGIGGTIKGYQHILPIEVGNLKFKCKIIFSREYKEDFNILGRVNFFEQFELVGFRENHKETILEF